VLKKVGVAKSCNCATNTGNFQQNSDRQPPVSDRGDNECFPAPVTTHVFIRKCG